MAFVGIQILSFGAASLFTAKRGEFEERICASRGKNGRKALQAFTIHKNNIMNFTKNSRFFFELGLMNPHRVTKKLKGVSNEQSRIDRRSGKSDKHEERG
jgi:hypothetical protein